MFEITNEYFTTNGETFTQFVGSVIRKSNAASASNQLDLEILKLHGSLNFPAHRITTDSEYNFVNALDDPAILPPVFNKFAGTTVNSIWKIAMERLREAKNICVVGYSLPRTDIYMQYFLKAALGPNIQFNRLFVYDPSLHNGSSDGPDMRQRYAECFSPQLQSRIDFNPPTILMNPVPDRGTALDFIQTLSKFPDTILF
jgi:hypothetical protein